MDVYIVKVSLFRSAYIFLANTRFLLQYSQPLEFYALFVTSAYIILSHATGWLDPACSCHSTISCLKIIRWGQNVFQAFISR
jgi:hypothetical protein